MWRPLVTLNWILFITAALGLAAVSGILVHRAGQIPYDFLTGSVSGEGGYVPLRAQPDANAAINGFLKSGGPVRIERQDAFSAGSWVYIEISETAQGWIERESVELTDP